MNELHALVDFENVQPSIEEVEKLAPGSRTFGCSMGYIRKSRRINGPWAMAG